MSPTAAGTGPLPSRLLTLYDTIAEHVGGVGEGEEGPALEALWGAVQPVRPSPITPHAWRFVDGSLSPKLRLLLLRCRVLFRADTSCSRVS